MMLQRLIVNQHDISALTGELPAITGDDQNSDSNHYLTPCVFDVNICCRWTLALALCMAAVMQLVTQTMATAAVGLQA